MDKLRTILARLYATLYFFILDIDYIAAYISFCLMCYHIITQDARFFGDMLIFFIGIGLFVLRKVNSIVNKLEAIETALNGAKIKRIELEAMKDVI